MPITDLSSIGGSDGIQQLAGPFGPILGDAKQFPSSYDFGKRFVSPVTTFGNSGNGVTTIDDPTYLGFTLSFDIMSPLFNGATSGSTSHGESAVGYLEKIGETTRAGYLKAFVQGIKEINDTRPYYWQTIGGLTEAWGKTVNMVDPYSGSGDEGITIGCLEALDLKMTALFNLYKMAVYDVKYKRTILPINLMYFTVSVNVLEIRKFKTARNWLNALNKSIDPTDSSAVEDFTNQNTSQVTFNFEECCWDATASGVVYENVTQAGHSGFATSSMKWKYGRVEMQSQFAGYDSALMDKANQNPVSDGFGLDDLKDNAKKFAKDKLANAAKGAVNKLERGIRSRFNSFALGNVFGLRNQIFDALRNPAALANAVGGAFLQEQQIGGQIQSRLGDNPLGVGIQPGNSLPSENINSGQIPSNTQQLSSSNIFGNGPSGPSPLNSTNLFN